MTFLWKMLFFFVVCVLPLAPVVGGAWPEAVRDVTYQSSGDNRSQHAMVYLPKNDGPVPLLVGLHSWSANYRQTNPGSEYAKWCMEKGWAFIGPDFRGPNKRPSACGSDLVVKDIVSAVDHMCQIANIDAQRIYLIGVSGGGHCALLMAGRRPDIWAGVSAWVPISDLKAWHQQTKAAGRNYWKDVEASCGGAPGANKTVDEQYRLRSPLTWLARAKNLPVDINAGITDGHNGSVPISHSLLAFNLIADKKDRLAANIIADLARSPRISDRYLQTIKDETYGDKSPLFRRTSGAARVTIFQGGHEIITNAGLQWLSKQRKNPAAADRK